MTNLKKNDSKNKSYNFLDLFAGCGGLSEGFIRAGFNPVAHIEMDVAASNSLKTRMCYHWLLKNKKQKIYLDYLNQNITRNELYSSVPKHIIDTVINKEISNDTLEELFEDIDKKLNGKPLSLIIGGPPCQAYSLIGRSCDKYNMKKDERNYLYKYYAKFLEHYKPEYFVFENVTGLLSAKDKNGELHFENMLSLFKKIGYVCTCNVLNAKDYGVPQNRKRVIIIGNRADCTQLFLDIKKTPCSCSISDLFSDLPEIKSGESSSTYKGKLSSKAKSLKIRENEVPLTYQISRPNTKQDLQIYKIAVKKWNNNTTRLNYNDLPTSLKSHNNHTAFTDRFKVVAGDLPYSHTIVAHVAKDGHYYIHPDIRQNRSLTPREVARIQTFPDNYYFEGAKEGVSRTSAYKQIGNAVPVVLAEKIAKHIKKQF